jgi:hypothetical protein
MDTSLIGLEPGVISHLSLDIPSMPGRTRSGPQSRWVQQSLADHHSPLVLTKGTGMRELSPSIAQELGPAWR